MAKWVREKIVLPPELKPRQRVAFLSEALRFIRERTALGRGEGGRRFPAYSKQYTQSLDFKNAEKSASRVNLKLSGDMLAAMDIISHKKGQAIYGFENGTPENDRAEGNITGSYGGRPNSAKVRNFIGLSSSEVNAIINRIKDE